MTQTPQASSSGFQETVRSGATECQFSPPVNTSQHALIPPSPKVTLSALQLASRPDLLHALLSWLFPSLDTDAAGFHGALPARATWSLIFHCHCAGEEAIKTNMWWQGVPDMMNRCNQLQKAPALALIGGDLASDGFPKPPSDRMHRARSVT